MKRPEIGHFIGYDRVLHPIVDNALTISASTAAEIDQRVRAAGLRPTRQRLALAQLLFARGDR
ncbi:hypothetical protein E0632_26900, partial [Salmonella enterica subsp. enterica]|nr:hypothetical protein [Salmonella enterica subsp. enterica]